MTALDTRPGALTRVPGFLAAGVPCGLKDSGALDLALVKAERPCAAAAVFTTNAFKAAPVLFDQALLARSNSTLQAVVINAGIANACTGEQGLRDAEAMARLAAEALALPGDRVFVMSTGVIGHSLPMDSVAAGIAAAASALSPEGGAAAAQAMMTTDQVPKEAFVQTMLDGVPVSIGGMAKGSGMIHPNLATMLVTLVTDANIAPRALDEALRRAVAASFNRLTVDGDTSTNDTVLLLAAGTAGHRPIGHVEAPNFGPFQEALTELCTGLARMIARDGEGATKLVTVTVRHARTEAEAELAAKTVATSPLVKTAIFGHDPNWGRILAAIGRSGASVDPARTSLWLGPTQVVAGGEPVAFDAAALSRWLADSDEVEIVADLALGSAAATVWTCDFSYRYVEINAEYHT